MGKMTQVSMPHASGAGAVWTVYTYDGLGRTTRVTNPDSSHKDYAYLGNTVTATDEAGAWKKYTMDAMGNLTQVEEPNPAGGSLFTYYTYDALNHLITVSMPRSTGTQTRTFNYGTPPGAFLLSATNPESGTVSYTYSQSRLATKTDAKGQQVQYGYDSYGRISQVRHYLPVGGGLSEDTCQQVNYTYDANGVGGFSYLSGRLATRSYSTCLVPNGTTTGSVRADFTDMFSYSQAGQVVKKRLHVSRTINTTPFPTTGQQDLDATWGYDGEGRMTSVSYPTGAGGPAGGSYTFGFDSMGRPSTMSDTSATLISGVTYGPAGELLTMTGTGYSESRSYNSRLQLTALNGVSFSYPTGNNGKISSQTDSVSGETITYLYDSLNRLVSAVGNGTWGQTYSYDGFGNLTAKTPAAGKTSAIYSAAFSNNKEVGLSYDANGNQVSDVTNYGSLQYDVENRLAWGQKGSSSNGNGYGYDPSNRRVYVSTWTYTTQWNLSNEEVTFWGVGGRRMGTYSLSTSGTLLTATGYNVYFGSKLVRKIDAFGTAGAVQPDRLGSFGKFAPYGEERTSTADNTEKFATYYRDGNTGLDYAMNRYYNSNSGRFLSADPYRSKESGADPGLWNRFSYVGSDPLTYVDPSGRDRCKLVADDSGNFYLTCDYEPLNQAGSPGQPDPLNRSGRDDDGRTAKLREEQALRYVPAPLRQQVENAVGRAEQDLRKSACAQLFNVPDAAGTLEDVFEAGRIRAAPFGDDLPAGIGGHTNPSQNAIYLASNRYFFTGQFNNGPVTQTTVDFQGLTQDQVQEVILIHELLHLTGVAGADTNSGVAILLGNGEIVFGSGGITAAVIRNCIK